MQNVIHGNDSRVESGELGRTTWPMNLAEMLEELPRLTHEERRLLCRRTIAIDAEQSEEIAAVEYAAAEGFALLDRMEAEDDSRNTMPVRLFGRRVLD